MVVVNAGMGGPISRHLQVQTNGLAVSVRDLTGHLGKLDLQGPGSARVMKKILADPENVLDSMPYFSFKGSIDGWPGWSRVVLADGTPVMLSRTGYTGEFGFELFVAPEALVRVWEMVLAGGDGVVPCGLAARDSLRTGAMLPLSHQDIGSWPFVKNPWSFALSYNDDRTDFTKDFLGGKAIRDAESADYTLAFVGYDPRKVSVHDPAVVLDPGGRELGTVLTCVSDLAIGRSHGRIYSLASPDKPDGFHPHGLCCGFLRLDTDLAPGELVELKDKRRTIKVEIVDDIRPDRTARCPIGEMIQEKEKRS